MAADRFRDGIQCLGRRAGEHPRIQNLNDCKAHSRGCTGWEESSAKREKKKEDEVRVMLENRMMQGCGDASATAAAVGLRISCCFPNTQCDVYKKV